jgi:hypothetical protein
MKRQNNRVYDSKQQAVNSQLHFKTLSCEQQTNKTYYIFLFSIHIYVYLCANPQIMYGQTTGSHYQGVPITIHI